MQFEEIFVRDSEVFTSVHGVVSVSGGRRVRIQESGFFYLDSWFLNLGSITKQESPVLLKRGFCKKGHRPTLPRITAVPSALAGLTSLFGMGRGGHRRYRHLNVFLLR